MAKFLALVLCLLASNQVFASDLTKALGDLVEATSKNGVHAVEFCPDNVCDRFTLRGRHSHRPLHDFVLTYLFGIDTDSVLKQFQAKTDAVEIQSVLARYHDHCPQPNPRVAARCIANYLARHHDIHAAFVRYDEGRWESPVPLSEYIDGT